MGADFLDEIIPCGVAILDHSQYQTKSGYDSSIFQKAGLDRRHLEKTTLLDAGLLITDVAPGIKFESRPNVTRVTL